MNPKAAIYKGHSKALGRITLFRSFRVLRLELGITVHVNAFFHFLHLISISFLFLLLPLASFTFSAFSFIYVSAFSFIYVFASSFIYAFLVPNTSLTDGITFHGQAHMRGWFKVNEFVLT